MSLYLLLLPLVTVDIDRVMMTLGEIDGIFVTKKNSFVAFDRKNGEKWNVIDFVE